MRTSGGSVDRLRHSVIVPWIIAVIGFPIGGLLAQTIAGPASTVPAAVLSGLIAGAIIGLAQAVSLGLRSQALALWVGGTAAGLAIALAIVTAAIGQIETSTEAVALGVASGVAIGAVQSVVLMRAGIANAWLWIVATGIAWAVGWLITAGVGVALDPGWPVYGASGAIVSQIDHGHRALAARPDAGRAHGGRAGGSRVGTSASASGGVTSPQPTVRRLGRPLRSGTRALIHASSWYDRVATS